MKLFLFKPSKRWRYCGGGLAIVASSFEECQALFGEKLHRTEEDANTERDDFHNWTLVATINCPEETEKRIVLSDYNWG